MTRECPRCQKPLSAAATSCEACGAPLPSVIPSRAPGPASAGAPGGARLVGTLEGQTTEFSLGQRTTLGRHPSNTVRLADREVSKEHAAIDHEGADWVLRDRGSSNGTFVNGRRVNELKLRDGDEISVGNSILIFRSGALARQGGVAVVSSAQAVPAFLASIVQTAADEEAEFLPVDRLVDIGALRADYEKLRIAHQFHRQVGRELTYASLLERILEVAFQLLAADHGVLFVDRDGTLEPAVVRPEGEEVIVSDTVLERVTSTRQAVLTADAILDARFSGSESIIAQGIRSAMAVPLLAKGEIKGVLFLDTRERTHAFSEKDLKILSAVASQAAIALENAALARQIETEAVARAELSRFLSPQVAEMVVKGQVEMLRAGRLAEVTVLFADIRGFTSLSESAPAQEVVSMLNRFFSAMAAVIFRHEGNLDKFIGDCVMAVWGPPSAHEDDPGRALQAALEMQEEVAEINRERARAGAAPIEVGIGVNTGQAVVGYMGSTERHEFTAIGDSVNLASRLCGVAKAGEIIAAAPTVRRAADRVFAEPLPEIHVKGKEKGVRAFRIRAPADEPS